MKHLLLILIIGSSCLLSCSKDAEPETTIDTNAVNLKYDQNHQFLIRKGSEGIPGSNFKWDSSDDNVGTISTDGNFKARKIGGTTITAKLKDQIFTSQVIVSEYSSLFTEPGIQFGLDKATIKQTSRGLLAQESENLLIYNAFDNSLKWIIYIFEYNNLIGVVLDFDDSEAVQKEVKLFYKERYPVIATIKDTNDSIYINDERDKAIHLTKNESLGFYASYGRVSFTNGRLSGESKSFEAILKTLNKK